jgi:uncharacterized protein (TIGR03382 family)
LASITTAVVLSTLTLDGEVVDDGSDYAVVEFEVPAGVAEIEVEHTALGTGDVLDWGLWGPDGFRGWGGGLTDNAIAGVQESTRGYVTGPIASGTWQVVIGTAKIEQYPAPYELRVTLRDAETQTPRPRAVFEPVVVESGARWYRGDFHVHSSESGDATATLDEIETLLRERGLDFAALSDHNTVSQHSLQAAFQAGLDDLLLIRGAEITTYGGHANGFGIESYVDHRIGFQGRDSAGIVADVNAQGGALSINHPMLGLGDLCIGCEWAHDDTPYQDVHAFEIHTGSFEATVGLFSVRAIDRWDELLDQGYRLTAIGGSDDHRAGMDTGTNASPIGSPTTLVWADELSEAAILDGVRAGRAIVQLRGPDDPIVELTVTAGDDTAVIGDTLTAGSVDVAARVYGGSGLELGIYRNGEGIEAVAVDSEDFAYTWSFDTAESGDRYRVQVLLGSLPVVVTNHVWVDYAPRGSGGGGCSTGGRTGAPAALLLLLLAVALLRRAPSPSKCQRQ